MAGNSGGKGGGTRGVILAVIVIVAMLGLFGGCTSANDKYRDTLESGYKKYQNGEPMTKQEHDAVENFNKWKSNQGEKNYNDW